MTAGGETVAVRCPAHPIARSLIQAAGVPIVAPSANLSGRPSPTDFETTSEDLWGKVAAIIDGGSCEVGVESTVVLPTGENSVRILRPGAVTAEMMEKLGISVEIDPNVLSPLDNSQPVLSPGMKHRPLGLDREEDIAGVSFCAVCDGAFYEGKDTAICGGGNTALQDALFLSDLCRHVTLIHRRREFRADPILVEAARKRTNVSILTDTVVEELLGGDSLTGLRLKNPITGETSTLAVDGLFEAVGQQPEGILSRALGVADEAGFIPAGESCLTSAAGIFAAGDCRTKEVRQLTTACADGAIAALAAVSYCNQ